MLIPTRNTTNTLRCLITLIKPAERRICVHTIGEYWITKILLSDYEEFSVGGLVPEPFPKIHSEEGGGTVKDGGQRTHKGGNHHRHHQAAHACKTVLRLNFFKVGIGT